MFTIDETIDDPRIAQFATQFEHIPPAILTEFERSFNGDQSLDFYKGLLSGIANSYSTSNAMAPNTQHTEILGFLTAYVTRKYVDLQTERMR